MATKKSTAATEAVQQPIKVSAIVKSYATLIKFGRKTIDEVPEQVRADVEAYLATME